MENGKSKKNNASGSNKGRLLCIIQFTIAKFLYIVASAIFNLDVGESHHYSRR